MAIYNTICPIVIGGLAFVATNGWAQGHPQVEAEYVFTPAPLVVHAHPRAKLIIGSSELVENITLLHPRFRNLGQLTQAQVTIQNLTENRYTLEYKFDWEDSEGFAVEGLGTWHRFTLPAGEIRRFTAMGQKPDAKKIVFTVRLPDDVFIEAQRQKAVETPTELPIQPAEGMNKDEHTK